MVAKKILEVREWEVLENGAVIERLEDGWGWASEPDGEWYEVWAGFGRVFGTCPEGCHSYVEQGWTKAVKVAVEESAIDCYCEDDDGNLFPYFAEESLDPDKRKVREDITRPIRISRV